MFLKSLSYAEYEGTFREWKLKSLILGKCNLLVGKNASGKSRTLNIIASLAKNLLGSKVPTNGNTVATFLDGQQEYVYTVIVRDEQVVREELTIDGNVVLERSDGGAGTLYSAEESKIVRFQAPTNMLAAVVRRDNIQHPYLDPLHKWAEGLRHYLFGTSLGHHHLAIFTDQGKKPDPRDSNQVVALFRQATKEVAGFTDLVVKDLQAVGYSVSSLLLERPHSVEVFGAGDVLGLSVQEDDLTGTTDQLSMSQGMFRVVSLLVHVNYFAQTSRSACAVIDDIGEGLDFDRSCKLIRLLREKAERSDIQLIMSTNDRFVMNEVPLEEWSVLRRKGSTLTVMNAENSRDHFEDFRFTGLSNFSFFELEFSDDAIELA